MQLRVFPSIDDQAGRALHAALGATGLKPTDSRPSSDAWRRAAFREAVDRDGAGADYAFSPRSTRGATRA